MEKVALTFLPTSVILKKLPKVNNRIRPPLKRLKVNKTRSVTLQIWPFYASGGIRKWRWSHQNQQ
jgi:hypothetical protein